MIVLRGVEQRDLAALNHLSQTAGLLNLPNDLDLLSQRIDRTVRSFEEKIKNKTDSKFMFVVEDISTGQVFGTSMIATQHGTVESPHFYFEVGSEKKFSEAINTGFIHGTLKLRYDTNGPSELGGLVLDPEVRNSEARLGRQISFVRFLFLGMNRARFRRKLIAELMPPLDKHGQSALWEAIGRRFTNMNYPEADRLCASNKEFIFSLFPSGKIYSTFLPPDARNAIGRVGKDTEPVWHMLTKIGFKYRNQIDPFDGGPHLWANVDDLLPLKKMGHYRYEASTEQDPGTMVESGLLAKAGVPLRDFKAVSVQATLKDAGLRILGFQAKEIAKVLSLSAGDQVAFMPYY